MISAAMTVDTIYKHKETFVYNHGIKILSLSTEFYIGNMSISSHSSFFFVNPYKTSLNVDVKNGYISINDERWIPYIFEDKNEYFQYQLMYNYHDLDFVHLIKLKELYDFICKKFNYANE